MLWEGSIYKCLRKYVVHNLLCLNLKPMAAAKHRLIKKERAEKKQGERDDKARTAQEEHGKSSSQWRQRRFTR
jgi:hypothetical protein